MKNIPDPTIFSKTRFNKAGKAFRKNESTEEDLEIINHWRGAHAYILNTFQATLRKRSKNRPIIVAQRIKRLSTVLNKLVREPNMQLTTMQDIAGCRLIFQDIASLEEFKREMQGSRMHHELKNETDYIANPKESGYRGIHNIYDYNVNSKGGRKWNGLFLEIQYRTIYQHAWATAVEVVGLITLNQPKFGQGEQNHIEFFRLASEIIARQFEKRRSIYAEFSDVKLVDQFKDLDARINLMAMFKNINAVNEDISYSRNVILIFEKDGKLESISFSNMPEALENYFTLEKQAKDSGKDIVLVRADSPDDIRSAFRNYFSDTKEFVRMIEEGCAALAA